MRIQGDIQEAEEWVGCSLLTGAEGLEPLQEDRAGGTSRGPGHRAPRKVAPSKGWAVKGEPSREQLEREEADQERRCKGKGLSYGKEWSVSDENPNVILRSQQ